MFSYPNGKNTNLFGVAFIYPLAEVKYRNDGNKEEKYNFDVEKHLILILNEFTKPGGGA